MVEECMTHEDRLANFKLNVDSSKWAMIRMIQMILEQGSVENASELVEKFTNKYETLIKQHETEDVTDIAKYYRLVTQFKPALAVIVEPGELFDQICDWAIQAFNATLNRVRGQINEQRVKKKATMELKFFCTVCNQTFDIPPEKRKEIENSSEKIELPKHHDKEMVVKIIRSVPESPKDEADTKPITIYSAELLMGHLDSTESNVEYLKILSVGIDIGSSTSHLVFSRLTLKRETSVFNITNRFNLVNREIIYEGNIIFTPLIDKQTIDIEKIIEFCENEYKNAEITPDMVDTGAVIVTGETAKKENAEEIVKRLSSESGKFVSASAGPNFESMLGIMGSGIVNHSRTLQQTIMNVDVGGGTSNIAIASNGDVLSTSCINVGGRLLGIDKNFKIWRIDEPTERVMKELNINYKLGDFIPAPDVRKIAKAYANSLLEVMRGPATSKIAKMLMMTADIEIPVHIDGYSFSGGIAEMIYAKNEGEIGAKDGAKLNPYEDIGGYLAEEIIQLVEKYHLPLLEPDNKIRATVIGAGAFSLSISGSTCYYDEAIELPLENIPVVPISLDYKELLNEEKKDDLKKRIDLALNNFNLVESEDLFALYFKDIMLRTVLVPLAKNIEEAFFNSIKNNKLILIILGGDGGKMLGLTIKHETAIKTNLFCLDELQLEAGDWIDIGAPLHTQYRKAFPVTIKSLVFKKNKNPQQQL